MAYNSSPYLKGSPQANQFNTLTKGVKSIQSGKPLPPPPASNWNVQKPQSGVINKVSPGQLAGQVKQMAGAMNGSQRNIQLAPITKNTPAPQYKNAPITSSTPKPKMRW